MSLNTVIFIFLKEKYSLISLILDPKSEKYDCLVSLVRKCDETVA